MMTEKVNKDARNFLSPTSGAFSDIASHLHHQYLSVSLFALSSKYMNFITISELTRSLGGDIHYFYETQEDYCINFISKKGRQFYTTFQASLTKEWCLEAVFRIRISWGWRIIETLGNFVPKVNDLLSVSGMSHDKALYYQFALEDQVVDRFYIQVMNTVIKDFPSILKLKRRKVPKNIQLLGKTFRLQPGNRLQYQLEHLISISLSEIHQSRLFESHLALY